MQVLVNCDDRIGCDEELIRRIEGVLMHALERFGDRVLRIEARLSDPGTMGPGSRDIVCRLEARVAGSASIVVKHAAGTLAQAIHDAAVKLERFLISELRRLDQALARSEPSPSARTL